MYLLCMYLGTPYTYKLGSIYNKRRTYKNDYSLNIDIQCSLFFKNK